MSALNKNLGTSNSGNMPFDGNRLDGAGQYSPCQNEYANDLQSRVVILAHGENQIPKGHEENIFLNSWHIFNQLMLKFVIT